jgi:hypothetical protein
MVRTIAKYVCEHCEREFSEENTAKKHERIPLSGLDIFVGDAFKFTKETGNGYIGFAIIDKKIIDPWKHTAEYHAQIYKLAKDPSKVYHIKECTFKEGYALERMLDEEYAAILSLNGSLKNWNKDIKITQGLKKTY